MSPLTVHYKVSRSKTEANRNPDATASISPKKGARKVKCFKCCSYTRYLVLMLVTLCLASIWLNILTFNFTVICMNPKESADGGGRGSEGGQNNATWGDNTTTNGTNDSNSAQSSRAATVKRSWASNLRSFAQQS
uniref:Uncharacterized protein n=1 Tax=Plectus sambesii TaxID=2011161 RepID=A0A914UU38_9BILA